MSTYRIVKVEAGLRGCEILADTPAQAEEIKKRCEAEGVWEARNGIRHLVIHRFEISRIYITKKTGAFP